MLYCIVCLPIYLTIVFEVLYAKAIEEKAVYSGEGYSHIEEDVDYQETSQLLEAALSGLSNRQRKIYTLQKLEGKSYKEISELLGISHSAINQNLQVANKYIRFFMKSRLPILLFLISSQIE